MENKNVKFIAASNGISCFDINGNIYLKNSVDTLVIEYFPNVVLSTSLSVFHTTLSNLPINESVPLLPSLSVTPSSLDVTCLSIVENNNLGISLDTQPFVFLIGSNTSLAKSSALELKLHWNKILGISFYDNKYISCYDFYNPHMKNMISSSPCFISLYTISFVIELFYCDMFGFEFKYASLSIYVNGKLKYSECSVSLFFNYKFLSEPSNLPILFPNHLVEETFSDINEYEDYFSYNNISMSHLSLIVSSSLKISGKLSLKSLYSNNITKFEYISSVKASEGVKFTHEKYHYDEGHISSCSVNPIFNTDLHSCSSVSFLYTYPYTKFYSFNTGGSMYKFCKSFKPEKFIQNSSVHKNDNHWKPGSYNKKIKKS